MAVYDAAKTNVKVIFGDVTSSQDSASVGSVASAAYAHIVTLDSTNNPILSISSKMAGYGNKWVVTIVSAS